MESLTEEVSRLIKWGNNERAKEILKENPELYQLDEASVYSFLHDSVVYNNVDMVQYLLNNGYNIDIQDKLGRTPLMVALQMGRYKLAEVLLSSGADLDELLSNCNNSVLRTTFANHVVSAEFLVQLLTKFQKKFTTSEETAQKLMDAGCQLYQAVFLKNEKIIEYMLEHGCSIHFFHPRDKLSALHFAVYYENFSIVDALWECGAAVSALDIQGRTPLFYLYYRNPKHSIEKLKILKFFLDTDTLLVLRKSTCAIFQIANILMRGNHEAVRLILQSYPDFLDEEKCSKKTMLHHLARNTNPGVVEELKLHIDKFNVNAIDKRGRNPLYWAFKARNVTMVQYLLEKGATITKIKSNIKTGRLIRLLKQNEDAQIYPCRNIPKKVRIFDVKAMTTIENNFKKIRLIIAHLAMFKQLGKPITKSVWSKIKSLPQLKKYYKKCRRVLQTEIYGKITVFKLLTGDEKKIALYLNQKKLDLKLERASYKRTLKSSFPYYFDIVRERIFEGRFRKTLKDNVTLIFRKICDNRFITNSLVFDKIMDYLNDGDLLNLYHAYK